MNLRVNILAIIGTAVGIVSMSMKWLTGDELAAMRTSAGNPVIPEMVFPNLSLPGLCDSGWVYSDELAYMVAAALFFIGTIMALYTSLGVLGQVVGYLVFFDAFESSGAAVIGDLPSGGGPKLALISMLFVGTSVLFPVIIGSASRPKGFWRRFLTISTDEDVKQGVPMIYGAAGAGLLLYGLVVETSSMYADGELSATLLAAAGMVLLVTGMTAIVFTWKAD